MALGTLTLVEQVKSDGPLFIDRVTLVGDGSYSSGGTTGLLAKLQAATKDARAIISCVSEDPSVIGVWYDQANEKLKVYKESAGTFTEVSGSQSGDTYKLIITSR